MSSKKKPIILGIVGVGRWGQRYLETAGRLWPEGNAVFRYGAGNSPGWTSERTGLVPEKFFEHWEDVIFQPDIDGLVVASPATTHYQVAAVALAHKIPVLIEKPATLSSRETEGLLRISNATKTAALVGHQHLYAPAFEAMRRLLLGHTISRIECSAGGPGPIRDTCSALWDWAPHDLAMAFTLCPDLRPGVRKAEKTSSPNGAESWSFILQAGNVAIEVELSNEAPTKKRRLTVITSDNLALTYDDRAEEKLTLDGTAIPVDAELPLDRQVRTFAGVVEDCRRGVQVKGENAAHLTLALRIASTIEEIERKATS